MCCTLFIYEGENICFRDRYSKLGGASLHGNTFSVFTVIHVMGPEVFI